MNELIKAVYLVALGKEKDLMNLNVVYGYTIGIDLKKITPCIEAELVLETDKDFISFISKFLQVEHFRNKKRGYKVKLYDRGNI